MKSNENVNDRFKLQRFFTSILGLWPLQKDDFYRKFRIGYSLSQMIIVTVSVIYQFIINCGGIDDTLDSYFLLIYSILIFIKIFYTSTCRDYLKRIIISSYQDWESIKNTEDIEVMVNNSAIYNNVSLLIYSCGLITQILYDGKIIFFTDSSAVPTLDHQSNRTVYKYQHKFLLPSSCIFNNVSKSLYYVILINEMVQSFIIAVGDICTDAMFLSITAHICGQFDILIKRMDKFCDNNYNFEVKNHELTMIIQRHQHLIFLSNCLEIVYNKVILMQMGVCLTSLSVAGVTLLLSINKNDIITAMRSVSTINFVILESYIYAYPADTLSRKGDIMLRAIYSYWYKFPNVNKNIVFITMRLCIAPYLTVGKFFNLTNDSFMSVIKTAFSYLSVLRLFIIK
ncbi:odorant receptor 4-like isoform X1 [Microplitis mediator]|uniref:odorant receptor 4-like isoform X1 n=1 Tax=Microplitis mediator TaxID=375433 RepID=UPI002554710E|nr:odorant receptor 4-like isoform X1 [Microplitis mediator]